MKNKNFPLGMETSMWEDRDTYCYSLNGIRYPKSLAKVSCNLQCFQRYKRVYSIYQVHVVSHQSITHRNHEYE